MLSSFERMLLMELDKIICSGQFLIRSLNHPLVGGAPQYVA